MLRRWLWSAGSFSSTQRGPRARSNSIDCCFPQADGPCALPRIECRDSPSFLSGGADRVAVKRDNGPGVLSTQQSIFAQDYPANPCLEGVDRADSLARLKCYFYGSKTVGSFCSFSRCSGSESNGFAVVPERFGSSLV